MSTLYLLIPLAAILVIVAAGLFIWSIKSGQFEDMEGPGFRILMDDDEDMIPEDAKVKKKPAVSGQQADNKKDS
ncbi:MAG: cbb3-type cytochrome oxidase assembly protein CcoS [Gammaproteobacteria bacterium]|jgi:cbb3-type cytochrome oxidase maturation protein